MTRSAIPDFSAALGGPPRFNPCQDSDLKTPLGYCISRDQYFKRDDVGIFYQVNVLPGAQRNLVGATLVKTVLERAPYGCRLFSGWCAQDLDAGYFWESLGFLPLAFRAGSRGKRRIHIFWQRRVREGDEGPGSSGGTPYWFPSQTTGGAIREDRLVFPIPPGTHWRDAKPLVLPDVPAPPEGDAEGSREGADTEAVPGAPGAGAAEKKPRRRRKKKDAAGPGAPSRPAGGLWFAPPAEPKPKRQKRPKQKNDPRYVAAARELRDRYLEQMNAGLLLPPAAQGKYDVSRALPSDEDIRVRPHEVRLLDAA